MIALIIDQRVSVMTARVLEACLQILMDHYTTTAEGRPSFDAVDE